MNDEENRWNTSFVRVLNEAVDEVEASVGAAALVTTASSPKFFSNGLDLEWRATASDQDRATFLKEFMALTANVRPRVILDKPISTVNLIKAACKILSIEWEGVEGVSENITDARGKLAKLIHEADSDTLRKVRDMLNKKEKKDPYFLFE